MKKIKHSKIKNTKIIFEILLRQTVTEACKIGQKPIAMSIIKKFFKEGTLLHRELMLYHLLSNRKKEFEMGESKVSTLIDEVVKLRKKFDEKQLRKEKYCIIKEMKAVYNIDSLFNTSIKDYKVLASIYKLFEYAIDEDESYNPASLIKNKYVILENLTMPLENMRNAEPSEAIKMYRQQNKDVRLLTYKLLIEKFNSKYSSLNSSQKKLIKKYVNNISNNDTLKEYVVNEIKTINETINNSIDKFKDDEALQVKLKELCKLTESITKSKTLKENQLVAVLKLYNLVDEIK